MRGDFRTAKWIFLATWVIGCAAAKPVRSQASPSTAAPPPAAVSDPSGNDEEAFTAMRRGFRECYQIGLWNNPHQSGSLRLVLKIDSLGSPASVTSVGGAGLDRMVVDCLLRVARQASFTPPEGGEGNIELPIKLGSDRQLEAGTAAHARRSQKRN